MPVYVLRKWPLRGRSRFVCWNITRVSLWLLCKVHFVLSIRPTIATWPRWPKGTDRCSSEEYRCTHVDACVWQELEYRIDVCRVTGGAHISLCAVSPVVHTSNISSCQKKILFHFSCGCEQFHWGRSFGFLVTNICNHGEHYETPCVTDLSCFLEVVEIHSAY